MNKRLLTVLLMLPVCSLVVMSQPSTGEDQKPNFIMILADDLGYADLSMNGSNQITTPNVDKLAKGGLTFTKGYVSSPVCSPSRAGLLTGVNQVEFGFDNNLAENQPGSDPRFAGLPINQKTIAKRLQELGYATGLVGKWHLGDKEQFHPLNRGFDEFWGYLGGGHDYFRAETGNKGLLAPVISNYRSPQEITYLTDDKGDECVDFIERHKEGPFFLYASFNAPHAPMQAREKDLALFGHISDPKRRTYAAMVYRLDINIGKIMESLEREGLLENTLVIFLSDNGGPPDQNSAINAPYRGQKGILLEGGIRVPFIFSWQSHLPGGETYDLPVSSLDIAPTLFELAGGSANKEDFSGVNLMPFVQDQKSEQPHETLMWRFTISAALLEDGWKLVRIPDRLPMLYYLPTDTAELSDVSLDSLHVTERLLNKLGEWDVRLPNPLFFEGAKWKKKQLDLYDQEYILEQPQVIEQN